jgi:hypothetical protein
VIRKGGLQLGLTGLLPVSAGFAEVLRGPVRDSWANAERAAEALLAALGLGWLVGGGAVGSRAAGTLADAVTLA